MQEQFQFDEHTVKITPSIGISFYQGEECSADELIKQADVALYDAKKSGRNMFKVYQPDSDLERK